MLNFKKPDSGDGEGVSDGRSWSSRSMASHSSVVGGRIGVDIADNLQYRNRNRGSGVVCNTRFLSLYPSGAQALPASTLPLPFVSQVSKRPTRFFFLYKLMARSLPNFLKQQKNPNEICLEGHLIESPLFVFIHDGPSLAPLSLQPELISAHLIFIVLRPCTPLLQPRQSIDHETRSSTSRSRHSIFTFVQAGSISMDAIFPFSPRSETQLSRARPRHRLIRFASGAGSEM